MFLFFKLFLHGRVCLARQLMTRAREATSRRVGIPSSPPGVKCVEEEEVQLNPSRMSKGGRKVISHLENRRTGNERRWCIGFRFAAGDSVVVSFFFLPAVR